MTLRRYITDFVGDKGTGTWEGNRLRASGVRLGSQALLAGFTTRRPSNVVVVREVSCRVGLDVLSHEPNDCGQEEVLRATRHETCD